MLAESVIRGVVDLQKPALRYVNDLRHRAFGDEYETNGKLKESELTKNFILDERARELYWECSRRTDLIRHDKFTTSSYVWQWKEE